MSEARDIVIEAGADAFGDGAHPSTRNAMHALGELAQIDTFTNILDMGCGSGILSLQAAQLFNAPVLAVDLDKDAVEAARRNVARNTMSDRITVIRSDGFSELQIHQRAPFDLIIANMLAEPLVELAGDMARHLVPEGIALLSGILSWKSPGIIEAYQQAGLTLCRKLSQDDWAALILQK